MKKIIWVMLTLLPLSVMAQTPQEKYIKKYAPLAVREMHRSGIPASITLAQGLLESGSGLSELATKGNNHFGIKCHKGWKGRTMRVDDDKLQECFRVYDKAEESYRDHSDFLRYRDRYKFLFDLDRTDYKGWAYGLKQAGYATDPKYPAKLIKYIEDYKLYRFDTMSAKEAARLPESPLKIEAPTPVKYVRNGIEAPVAEQYSVSLSRQQYSLNGVPFVYASDGETYESIARDNHLFKKEILRYNDLSEDSQLLPGTVVYLEPKKKKAPAGLEEYIVAEDGEDFHAICQRFAVREKAVLKRNRLTPPVVLYEGDVLKLR